MTVNNDANPEIKLFENANNTAAIKNVSDKNILNYILSNILTRKNKNVKKDEPISQYLIIMILISGK